MLTKINYLVVYNYSYKVTTTYSYYIVGVCRIDLRKTILPGCRFFEIKLYSTKTACAITSC